MLPRVLRIRTAAALPIVGDARYSNGRSGAGNGIDEAYESIEELNMLLIARGPAKGTSESGSRVPVWW